MYGSNKATILLLFNNILTNSVWPDGKMKMTTAVFHMDSDKVPSNRYIQKPREKKRFYWYVTLDHFVLFSCVGFLSQFHGASVRIYPKLVPREFPCTLINCKQSSFAFLGSYNCRLFIWNMFPDRLLAILLILAVRFLLGGGGTIFLNIRNESLCEYLLESVVDRKYFLKNSSG